MKRRIKQFAVLVSTLLMAGCVAVWVRSYWARDGVEYCSADGSWAMLWSGGIAFLLTDDLNHNFSAFMLYLGDASILDVRVNTQTFVEQFGFGFETNSYPIVARRTSGSNYGIVTAHRLHAPLWFLTLLFAILPAWTLIRHFRQRIPEGCCKTCGYDLRASKDRCPECGTAIVPHTGLPVGNVANIKKNE